MRITAVAKRRGHRARIEHHAPHRIINAAGGDARPDQIGAGIKYLGRQATGLAHRGKAIRPVQLDGAIAVDARGAVNKLILVHPRPITRAQAKSYFASAKAALYWGLSAAITALVTGSVTS